MYIKLNVPYTPLQTSLAFYLFYTHIFSQGLSNDSRPSRNDTKANARKARVGGNNKNQGGQSRPRAGPGAPLPAVPGKYTPFQMSFPF